MDSYDTDRLAALGRRRRKLNTELAENRREIIPEMIAARRADVPQGEVADLAGYTREQLRRLERAHGISKDS